MKRLFRMTIVFIGAAAVMAAVMIYVSGRVKLYLNVNPTQYARKNVRWMRNALHLTPDQALQIQDILVQHKQSANALDREELEGWERLFQSLPTASDADLRRQTAALNELSVRRNALRVQTLITLRQHLDDRQKQDYGNAVSALVHKYLAMLMRVFA